MTSFDRVPVRTRPDGMQEFMDTHPFGRQPDGTATSQVTRNRVYGPSPLWDEPQSAGGDFHDHSERCKELIGDICNRYRLSLR